MKRPKPTRGGMHKVTALVLVFVGMKLGGQLDWSWWWALSPFWIACVLGIALDLRCLSAPPQDLWTKTYLPEWKRVSGLLENSDGLFLLLFILKWTGHLSWSWFWVLFPLWLLKPLGYLVRSSPPAQERRVRRHKRIADDLTGCSLVLVSIALVALRLDGHISSWWWVAGVFLFNLNLTFVVGKRMKAALSNRLRPAGALIPE